MVNNDKNSFEIVRGDGDKRPYFPDIIKRKNGELLVCYYWNSCHVPITAEQDQGIVRMIRSQNEGNTWSDPVTVVDWRDKGLEARDPNILELHNGDLLLTFFTYSYKNEIDFLKNRQTYAMRSIDGGKTWTEPVMIKSRNVWNARQGTAAVLENGQILIPLYGSHDFNPALDTWRISVIRSSDGGVTWGDETEIAVCSKGEKFNEAALLYTGNQTIYCLTRESGMMFKSTDTGRTWTREFTIGHMHRPHFLKLTDSLCFVTWSNPVGVSYSHEEPAGNRRVMGNLLDLQTGWNPSDTRIIYDSPGSGVRDMGYSASVLLDDNRILTIYYDTFRSVLAGTFTKLHTL